MKRLIVMFFMLAAWCGAAVADPLLLPADLAHRQAKSGEILLIDIRTPQEWRRTGVPDGAIPLTMHTAKDAFYDRVLAAVGRDKTKPVALICAAGNRSRWARDFLARNGFASVANVAEGFFGNGVLPGWLARGLPTVKHQP